MLMNQISIYTPLLELKIKDGNANYSKLNVPLHLVDILS